MDSKSQGVSGSSNVARKEEVEETHQTEKNRCAFGFRNEPVIKCEAALGCGVSQHSDLVLIPKKSKDLASPPEISYCQLCRLTLAHPSWMTVANLLYPVNLQIASTPATAGSNPVQSIEKTFQLTRGDMNLLSKQDYGVQAWCMLLNDKVPPFRMQWPQYPNLEVNGLRVEEWQLIDAYGRHDGPIITPFIRGGMNKIFLTGCDARVFCLGVRIVKRQTVLQVG